MHSWRVVLVNEQCIAIVYMLNTISQSLFCTTIELRIIVYIQTINNHILNYMAMAIRQ